MSSDLPPNCNNDSLLSLLASTRFGLIGSDPNQPSPGVAARGWPKPVDDGLSIDRWNERTYVMFGSTLS